MDIEEVKRAQNENKLRGGAMSRDYIDWLISEHGRLSENRKLFAAQNNDNAQENSELRETNRRQWEEIALLKAALEVCRTNEAGWVGEVERLRRLENQMGSGWALVHADVLRKEAEAVTHLAERLQKERNALAEAIGTAVVSAGIAKFSFPMTGPELILMLDGMTGMAIRAERLEKALERIAAVECVSEDDAVEFRSLAKEALAAEKVEVNNG